MITRRGPSDFGHFRDGTVQRQVQRVQLQGVPPASTQRDRVIIDARDLEINGLLIAIVWPWADHISASSLSVPIGGFGFDPFYLFYFIVLKKIYFRERMW